MKAYLLTIGDELLIGQTVNTNAAWIGEQLSLLGIDVIGNVVVGDEAARIRRALGRAFEEVDLVVTTGGLGPTHDDLTREAVGGYLDARLETDEGILRRIESYYVRTGRPVPKAVRALAQVPRGFDVLANPMGTAPGLWHAGGGRTLVVLPGVPQEMQRLMTEHVLPRLRGLRGRDHLRTVAHGTLLTTGIGESRLQEKIGDLSDLLGPSLKLAYLPSTSGVRLRLSAHAATRAEAEEAIHRLEIRLRERIGRYVFGAGTDALEAVVGRLLRERGLTLAVAESATGGCVLHRLTGVPGASAYVTGGIVAYANTVKVEQLGVALDVLKAEGAVSEAVARQMAHGVRKRLGADLGLSTTGIAGPSGGTAEKPVGTVWIGCANAQNETARSFRFTEDRDLNKELFSTAAIETIRRQVLGIGGREGPWPTRSAHPSGTLSS